MSLSILTLSIILFFLIILLAFFSGSEIGMMSLNRYRLKHLVKKNDPRAIRVSNLLARPEKLLSVILIGSTLTNIISSTITTLIGQQLGGEAGVVIATIILTVVILVFAELLPKTLAALYPQYIAFFAALPLLIIQTILAPIVQVISYITKVLLAIFGITINKTHKELLSNDEIRSVVLEAGSVLRLEDKGMLISILELNQASVEDIMIPKVEIIGIDLKDPWSSILKQLKTAQHTRLPVYQENIDQLMGIVHVRDILNISLESSLNKTLFLSCIKEPYFIPEGTLLNIQLFNSQKLKERSGFVVDEYGDLLGLITFEDILEEIVGEFTTDLASLSKEIVPQADGSMLIDASITLRQLKRVLSWQFPALGPRTLSGLIVEYLGYIPAAGSCLRMHNYQIEILKVANNMIKNVQIKFLEKL